jgi:hypothetical protein
MMNAAEGAMMITAKEGKMAMMKAAEGNMVMMNAAEGVMMITVIDGKTMMINAAEGKVVMMIATEGVMMMMITRGGEMVMMAAAEGMVVLTTAPGEVMMMMMTMMNHVERRMVMVMTAAERRMGTRAAPNVEQTKTEKVEIMEEEATVTQTPLIPAVKSPYLTMIVMTEEGNKRR